MISGEARAGRPIDGTAPTSRDEFAGPSTVDIRESSRSVATGWRAPVGTLTAPSDGAVPTTWSPWDLWTEVTLTHVGDG